jgi:hypothetical protein
MKNSKRSFTLAAVAAALTLGASGAMAENRSSDLVYDCKVFAQNSSATRFYLKANTTTGKLVYTTDSATASIFTFARDQSWAHDATGGAKYNMATRDLCVSTPLASPTSGTKVAWNYACSSANEDAVSVTNIDNTVFTLRIRANQSLYFTADTLTNGGQVILSPKPSTGFGASQKYYTSNCRDVNFGSYRPAGN